LAVLTGVHLFDYLVRATRGGIAIRLTPGYTSDASPS
jgi:hypothetical protein